VADETVAFLTTSGQADTVWATVRDGAIDAAVTTPGGNETVTLFVGCRGKRFERSIDVNPDAAVATRAYHIRDALTGRPIEDALVSLYGSARASASRTGTFVHGFRTGADTSESDDAILSIKAPGYIPVVMAGIPPSDTIDVTPWFGGALTGLRFVIDPEGGRATTTGIGPLGLSGAHANLQVARYLAGYLRAAGSSVLLTRTNDEVRTPEDIARMTNRFGTDRYIEIRHRSAPLDSPLVATTYHFPGSATGTRMAASVLDAMSGRMNLPGRGPFDTVTYPLQQTACPAIVVAAPSIASLEEELRLAESWYQREQAYTIFLGVLKGQINPGGADAAGWRVTVEGTWTLVTGTDGIVLFEKIPPGEYRLSAVKSGRLFGDVVRVAPGERAVIRFTAEAESRDRTRP
jgi:N-acetylmuramoyl-L-alanine amidase